MWRGQWRNVGYRSVVSNVGQETSCQDVRDPAKKGWRQGRAEESDEVRKGDVLGNLGLRQGRGRRVARACVRACVRCGCAGESWSTSEQPANGRRAEKPAGSWRQNATRIYRLERSVGEVGEEVFKWYFFLKKSKRNKRKMICMPIAKCKKKRKTRHSCTIRWNPPSPPSPTFRMAAWQPWEDLKTCVLEKFNVFYIHILFQMKTHK